MDAKGKKALIVEDDEGLQEALREILEENGFQVLQAFEGESGLRILKQIGKDLSLVICDVLMPKMGGTELYYQTRANYPGLVFIFITGHPEAVIRQEINADPQTYLLLKPLHKLWMTLAVLLGWLMTRIILIVLFYLVVTPIGLLARVCGKDFLNRDFDRKVNSYWIPRKTIPFDRKSYERQF